MIYGGGAYCLLTEVEMEVNQPPCISPHSDEVSAVVIDIGSSSTRLGYAGEDSPRSIIPTSYGYINRTATAVGENGMEVETQTRDLYVGENGINRWRPGMEVGNPMADSLSESPNAALTSGTKELHWIAT